MAATTTLRPSRALAFTLTFAVLAGAAPALAEGVASPADVLERAFDFRFEDINPASATHGELLSLSGAYAERGVVLNFLASWCKYCWEELPALERLHRAGEASVLGIAADEFGDPRNVLMLVERAKLTMPILFVPDEEQSALMEEWYDHDLLPTTYLIDNAGGIRRVLEGKVPVPSLFRAIDRSLHPLESAPQVGEGDEPAGSHRM